MDIFDEIASNSGHTGAELGVPMGPSTVTPPPAPKPTRLTRGQTRAVVHQVAERHGARVTESATSFGVHLEHGHCDVRGGGAVVFFQGAFDKAGATTALGWDLRASLKAALKSPPPARGWSKPERKISVRHNGHPGGLAEVVEAAIVAACPAASFRGTTPVWDGEEWAIYWYSPDRADVRVLGMSCGFEIRYGVVGDARSFAGDFESGRRPVPYELVVVAGAVASALGRRAA